MSAVKPVPDPGVMFPLTSDSDRLMRLMRQATRRGPGVVTRPRGFRKRRRVALAGAVAR